MAKIAGKLKTMCASLSGRAQMHGLRAIGGLQAVRFRLIHFSFETVFSGSIPATAALSLLRINVKSRGSNGNWSRSQTIQELACLSHKRCKWQNHPTE
jgi:Zn finger protein HypA/HybF involved in hydrogenase expression